MQQGQLLNWMIWELCQGTRGTTDSRDCHLYSSKLEQDRSCSTNETNSRELTAYVQALVSAVLKK